MGQGPIESIFHTKNIKNTKKLSSSVPSKESTDSQTKTLCSIIWDCLKLSTQPVAPSPEKSTTEVQEVSSSTLSHSRSSWQRQSTHSIYDRNEEAKQKSIQTQKLEYEARPNKVKVAQTLVYLAANTKVIVRVINNAVKFTGFSSNDAIDAHDVVVKGAQHALHTMSSVIQAIYTIDDTHSMIPAINNIVFHIYGYNFLKSNNKIIQCGIDTVSTTMTNLAVFDLRSALINAGITGTKCAIGIFDEGGDMIPGFVLSSLDALRTLNNFASTYNVIIKAVEVIKLGYIAYDAVYAKEEVDEDAQTFFGLVKEDTSAISYQDSRELIGSDDEHVSAHAEL